MLLYPEVQRRGQEELDRVLGRGNLPTFEDMERLPYVTAIYKEVLRYGSISHSVNLTCSLNIAFRERWHPVTPFGKYGLCTIDNNLSKEYKSSVATLYING